MKNKTRFLSFFAILLMLALACNLPGSNPPAADAPSIPVDASPESEQPPEESEITTITHVEFPASAPESKLFYDAESSGTAPEKRAPYGDYYDSNLLERPFLQDMTYVEDLDVATFSLSQDADWYYVSIRTMGKDPNNTLGINYAVELDKNRDGFGDFIILAQPPYTEGWSAGNVQVYADTNRDTSAISPYRSDAPDASFKTDGYDTLIFDGGHGDDPDLAWVRIYAGPNATIQFAFKRSWAGNSFMFGVLTDAGIKDVSQLDYVDRFTEEEAGSPLVDSKYYPLRALYAVDNTCWEAYGFTPTGNEPKICLSTPAPTNQPGQPGPTATKKPGQIEPTKTPVVPVGCTNPGQYSDQSSCEAAGCFWAINPDVWTHVQYYCVLP